MARFSRENYLITNEIEDVAEKDLIMQNFDLFKIKRPQSFYTIVYSDLKRPDHLSIKLYGKMDYWWILGKLNQIDDWWNDLNIGDVIIVPNIQDIEDFYMEVRKNI